MGPSCAARTEGATNQAASFSPKTNSTHPKVQFLCEPPNSVAGTPQPMGTGTEACQGGKPQSRAAPRARQAPPQTLSSPAQPLHCNEELERINAGTILSHHCPLCHHCPLSHHQCLRSSPGPELPAQAAPWECSLQCCYPKGNATARLGSAALCWDAQHHPGAGAWGGSGGLMAPPACWRR